MATNGPRQLRFKKLFKETPARPDWVPNLVHCGSYDGDLKAFPVKDGGTHLLWIPRECKFGLRFMNHVIYCVWHASRSQSFPHDVRHFLARVAAYTDQLRSGFFDEVIEYWYPVGTRFPTQEITIPRSEPLQSFYLANFLEMMYTRDTPVPGTHNVWEPGMLDPLKCNWEEWAQRKLTNRILFGTFLSERQREEDFKAGILHAPSVEIDNDSWSQYASALYEEYLLSKRDRVDEEIPPGHRSDPKTIEYETSEKPRMKPDTYTLQLNRTHLLFIPLLAHDPNSTSGTVVQVCIRSGLGDGDVPHIFPIEQASVTTTIETLLVGHVNALYKLPKCVIIKEVVLGYNLIGARKPWNYGREKKFCLGDAILQPAEDKWIFYFEKASELQ